MNMQTLKVRKHYLLRRKETNRGMFTVWCEFAFCFLFFFLDGSPRQKRVNAAARQTGQTDQDINNGGNNGL